MWGSKNAILKSKSENLVLTFLFLSSNKLDAPKITANCFVLFSCSLKQGNFELLIKRFKLVVVNE